MAKHKYYTAQLFDFLTRLSRNNNREWFAQNRAEYDELRGLWLDDLQRLINAMGADDPRILAITPKKAAFRIYRDTRFSLDKTPYKTYFSAQLTPGGGNVHTAGYYLHMSPDAEAGLYGGIWQPETPVLKKLRKAIVDNIEEFEDIISNPEMLKYFPDWTGQQLKTVPKGYDRNHPLAHLLRLKDIGRFDSTGCDFFLDPAWPEKAAERLLLLRPLLDFLDYSITEDVYACCAKPSFDDPSL